MNNRKDTTRRDDITNVRALAIFLVVLGHSIILYSSAWGYYPTEQKSILLDNLKFLINGIQMPLFFSLSGFCFYGAGIDQAIISVRSLKKPNA